MNLSDPTIGLGSLSSYHATLSLQFEGTSGGAAAAWSRSYDLRVAGGGGLQSLLEMQYSLQNQGESGTTRLIADAEGYQYEKVNQEACTVIASEQTTGLLELWELAGFLPGINGATLVGEETIESILTYHYQFDELALGQSDLTESSGEVWVAADSGTILRFLLNQKANASYFGEGIEGILKWSYQVAEINQPQRFNLPGDCQPPLVLEVPVPADASDLSQQETLLSFTTSLSEGEVADYYRQNLETLGWQPIDTLAFEMSGFDFGDLDLSGFDDENFNWEDFDESEWVDVNLVGLTGEAAVALWSGYVPEEPRQVGSQPDQQVEGGCQAGLFARQQAVLGKDGWHEGEPCQEPESVGRESQ